MYSNNSEMVEAAFIGVVTGLVSGLLIWAFLWAAAEEDRLGISGMSSERILVRDRLGK